MDLVTVRELYKNPEKFLDKEITDISQALGVAEGGQSNHPFRARHTVGVGGGDGAVGANVHTRQLA